MYALVRNAAVVATVLVAFVSTAPAQHAMHGRVGFDAGGTMVRGAEDADWSFATTNTLILPGDTLWVDQGGTSEIEFAGGTFLRLADGSKVEMYSLPPTAEFRAWAGAFYVQRTARSTGNVVVRTPAAAISVERDTAVRIDIGSRGHTIISVRWGEARVRVDGGGTRVVTDRRRVYVDPGYLPSELVPFDTAREDDFDTWNRERAQILAYGVNRVPATIPVSHTTIGYADLHSYGDWVNYGGRQYWRPTYERNYVPYRRGHWSYVPSIGYVWIGSEPFSYVTSHYGRWTYLHRYGWCWQYDSQWSPAWVATVRYGPNMIWTPVDFDNRPVLVSNAATFQVGGIQFSFAATSFVPEQHLYYGPAYTAPVRPAIVQNINVTNINVWNLSSDSRAAYVNVPFKDARMSAYSPKPQRVVRGLERSERKSESARQVALKLEKQVPIPAFEIESAGEKQKTGKVTLAKREDAERRVRLEANQRNAKRTPRDKALPVEGPKPAKKSSAPQPEPDSNRAQPGDVEPQGEPMDGQAEPKRNEKPKREKRHESPDRKGAEDKSGAVTTPQPPSVDQNETAKKDKPEKRQQENWVNRDTVPKSVPDQSAPERQAREKAAKEKVERDRMQKKLPPAEEAIEPPDTKPVAEKKAKQTPETGKKSGRNENGKGRS